MRSSAAAFVATAALGVTFSPPGLADDEKTQDCIQLNSVNRTDVVSDYSIVFYMRDGRILLNSMPNRCPQLGHEKRFMYTVPQGRLCRSDAITVLTDFGFGLDRGATCILSQFTPISKAAAAALKADGDDPRRGSRVTSKIIDKGKPHEESQDSGKGGDASATAGAAGASTAAGAASADDAAQGADDTQGRSRKRRRDR